MARRIAELEEERKGKSDRVDELSNMCDFLGQARCEHRTADFILCARFASRTLHARSCNDQPAVSESMIVQPKVMRMTIARSCND